MMRELVLFKMLAAMVCIVLAVLLAVWAYRYVQYRRAVRLSQMRWLQFETSKAYAEVEAHQALDWPSMASMTLNANHHQTHQQQTQHLLSPIPEERGGGRDSIDSLGSAKRDLRQNASSFISYGSVEIP